jgi:hypothetical protein
MGCRRCGSALPDDARYCDHCATPVAAVADESGIATALSSAGPPVGSPTAPKMTARSRLRRRMLAALAAATLVLGGLAVAGWREHWPPALFGPANSHARTAAVVHGAPAEAITAVAKLVSRSPATVRDSLAAIYSAQVNAAALAPAGTRIRVLPGTWRQHGSDASLLALVIVPGRAPVTEVVYLVQEEGRWRVQFTGAP